MEDKRRSERRLEERRSKNCFFFKITGPSNNFEFSKLPLRKHFDFSSNFVYVRLQIKNVFELFR